MASISREKRASEASSDLFLSLPSLSLNLSFQLYLSSPLSSSEQQILSIHSPLMLLLRLHSVTAPPHYVQGVRFVDGVIYTKDRDD